MGQLVETSRTLVRQHLREVAKSYSPLVDGWDFAAFNHQMKMGRNLAPVRRVSGVSLNEKTDGKFLIERRNQQLLTSLALEQIEDNVSLGLVHDGSASSIRQVIDQYEASHHLLSAREEAKHLFRDAQSSYEIAALKGALVGRVFEDLAFMLLTERRRGQPSILLSPERTAKFYLDGLFSDGYKIKGPFANGSIVGISVPDGVAVEQADKGYKVTEMLEYKAGMGMSGRDFVGKLASFRVDQQAYPALFQNSPITVVSTLNSYLSKPIERRQDVQLVRLPLSRAQFSSVLMNMFPGIFSLP